MAEKRLLREWEKLDCSPVLIKESREQNGGKLFLKGIMQRAQVPNQNKRIYPDALLRREVENYQKSVREARALGELDHPESSSVSLQNVSHVVREMWWEAQNVMGRVEILTTPNGKILESLIESGVTIGISSRGVGSTEKDSSGLDIVQEDFQLICFDIVSEPSTPGAYMFAEGKQIDLSVNLSKGDRLYRSINDILSRRKAHT